MQHVALVSLDTRGRNDFDQPWVGDDDAPNQGRDLIVERPGVGGRFDDECIRRAQVFGAPQCPLAEVEAARRQNDLLLRVDAARDQVMLVDVEGEVTFKG